MGFFDKITVKPWEHAGESAGPGGEVAVAGPVGRTGLVAFLAVISSMFGLFIVSYYTRSLYPDWEVMQDPGVLWVNTAVLVLASVALQLASHFAKRGLTGRAAYALLAGAGLTLFFMAGQYVAWEQLIAAGYYAQSNPANAFFYLFTLLHALHLVGGLWFMAVLAVRWNRRAQQEGLHQSVALYATYWHYLLLVWLVLFTLFLRT